jgi:hypothetical protein
MRSPRLTEQNAVSQATVSFVNHGRSSEVARDRIVDRFEPAVFRPGGLGAAGVGLE